MSRWAGSGRWAGARKRLADLDPGLRPALLALIERGDPMSPLRWTTKSTRVLAAELTRHGHRAGPDTVAALLREEGFSLQGNAKTIEGKQSPDLDARFRYLNDEITRHQNAGEPVISVDTEKKEQVCALHAVPPDAVTTRSSTRPTPRSTPPPACFLARHHPRGPLGRPGRPHARRGLQALARRTARPPRRSTAPPHRTAPVELDTAG
jgi:hypothetical protein